jgi:hypothetical protein
MLGVLGVLAFGSVPTSLLVFRVEGIAKGTQAGDIPNRLTVIMTAQEYPSSKNQPATTAKTGEEEKRWRDFSRLCRKSTKPQAAGDSRRLRFSEATFISR